MEGVTDGATTAPVELTSFSDVWLEHHDASVRLAFLLTGDAAHAEDIVADAMLKVYRRSRSTAIDDHGAYVRRAVVNQSRSWLRKLWVRRRHAQRRTGDARGSLGHAEVTALRDEVYQAVLGLPRRQRECIVLRYWADLPLAQVAATLEVSVGTVKSSISRGLDRLGAALDDREGRP